MAITLDRIISEFWFGHRDIARWSALENWPEIIEEARRRDVALATVLELIRLGIKDRNFVHTFLRTIHKLFVETAIWFFGSHDRDWLGVIPKDVLGIICEYMRVEVHDGNPNREKRTCVLGVEHSFDDQPSFVKNIIRHERRWHRAGELWRINGRPPIIDETNGFVGLYWSDENRVWINKTTGQCLTPSHDEIKSAKIIEQFKLECRRIGIEIGAQR